MSWKQKKNKQTNKQTKRQKKKKKLSYHETETYNQQ